MIRVHSRIPSRLSVLNVANKPDGLFVTIGDHAEIKLQPHNRVLIKRRESHMKTTACQVLTGDELIAYNV